MALKRDVTYSGRFNAASPEHPQGEFKNRTSPTSEDGSYLEQQWLNDWDGFMSSLLSENSIVPNGLVDEVGASQYFEGMLRLREVSPRNNDWNGYLDPEHQSSLPAPNGYPGTSGGGEVVYTADEEISFGIFAGSGGATVSSDSDGWIFTGSIYKLFDYTTAQLDDIDVNAVPVYLKGQDGSEYFVNNTTTGVNVTKPDVNTLKVEITDAIFAELGITKLWRFFVTERVGRVVELSDVAVAKALGVDYIFAENDALWGNGILVNVDNLSKFDNIKLVSKASGIATGASGIRSTIVPTSKLLAAGEANVYNYTIQGSTNVRCFIGVRSVTNNSLVVAVQSTFVNVGLLGIYGV